MGNKVRALIAIVFLLVLNRSYAQSNQRIDSLSLIAEKDVPYKTYYKIRNEIGNFYVLNGQYQKGLEVYYAVLSSAEKNKDSTAMALLYNNIATVYREIGKNELVYLYASRALALIKHVPNYTQKADIHNTIGNYYYENYIDSLALFHLNTSYQYRLKAGIKKDIAISLKNLGSIHYETGQQQKGLEYVRKSLDLRKEIGDKNGVISSYLGLGEMYYGIKNYSTALHYLNLGAVDLDSTITPYIKRQYYENLASLNAELKNFEEAYKYSILLADIKDSILNTENNEQIAELQTKYETRKKEQALLLKNVEIKRQKEKNLNQLFLFSSLGFIVLGIFVFIFYRNKQRQKSMAIKEQNRQDNLRFKAVIESEENERIRIATELHDGLGQILSSAKLNISGLEGGVPGEDEYLLNNAISLLDEAVTEVRNISHNMMPAAIMKYNVVRAITVLADKINDTGHISVSFEHSDFSIELKKETEITLYRIVQEILNNMIKHAQTKKIDIILTCINNQIFLKISDYGLGFDTSKIEFSEGIGWKNIYSRVKMLGGKIEVKSEIEKGTTIDINFNI